MDEERKPMKEFKQGAVKACVWPEGGITLGRLYKDDDDKWQTSGTLYARHAEDAMKALQEAVAWVLHNEVDRAA